MSQDGSSPKGEAGAVPILVTMGVLLVIDTGAGPVHPDPASRPSGQDRVAVPGAAMSAEHLRPRSWRICLPSWPVGCTTPSSRGTNLRIDRQEGHLVPAGGTPEPALSMCPSWSAACHGRAGGTTDASASTPYCSCPGEDMFLTIWPRKIDGSPGVPIADPPDIRRRLVRAGDQDMFGSSPWAIRTPGPWSSRTTGRWATIPSERTLT